jgi:hypothetical protein
LEHRGADNKSQIALTSFERFLGRVELANIEYRRMNMVGKSESRPFEVCFPCFVATRRSEILLQLPGVLPTLRKIHGLDLVEGEFKLTERIQALVDEWSHACPFLNLKNPID